MRARLVSLSAVVVLVLLAGSVRAQVPDAVAAPDPPVDMKTLQDRVAELEAQVAELRANLVVLESQLKEKDEEVGEIVRALSRRDSANNPILALNNIMQSSEEFRREMSEAVNESIRTHGKLVIDNRTSGVQHLSINGQTHRIEALARHEFEVPVGTLTTELIGQESAKNWTITAPGYQQKIVIRPAARQVIVNSPTVYVGP